ncbi:MAG TPA: YhdT family protein [Candidatus Aphodousia gallistercoris]|nr:YhdT family protein [Candidatus Aphodousia gallistercoris]
MKTVLYEKALKQADKEALCSVAAAVLITLFFWASIYWAKDSLTVWFGLPLWFWLSCIGGYFFSILVVGLLVRFFFRDNHLESVSAEIDG